MPAVPSVDWEPRPFLIERYSPPAMRAVWSDQHKFELWLRIEVLACEAWVALGRIPESALPKIRKGTFEATKIAEVESRVGHDVIAFLTVLNESIGQPEARYVHLGMTSQDLNDSAMAVQMVESARLIGSDLAAVREAAAQLAVRHRRTLMAGRTHGIVAEPITFGLKVAGRVAQLDRSLTRLELWAGGAGVGRVSGAAAQAQSRLDRARLWAGTGRAGAARHGPREHGSVARARHQPLIRRARHLSRRVRDRRLHGDRDGQGLAWARGASRPNAR